MPRASSATMLSSSSRALPVLGGMLKVGIPEAVDVLERVTHTNNTAFDETVEQRMVNGALVLIFVNHDAGKAWKCSSEQCGHINLIVIVDEAFVGAFDAFGEDGVDDFLGVFIGGLVHGGGELVDGGEALGSGVDIGWDVA